MTFNPKYVVPDRAKPNLDKLKSLASQADDVFLATDLDREGEAIAYHLGLVLRLNTLSVLGSPRSQHKLFIAPWHRLVP